MGDGKALFYTAFTERHAALHARAGYRQDPAVGTPEGQFRRAACLCSDALRCLPQMRDDYLHCSTITVGHEGELDRITFARNMSVGLRTAF